MLATYGMHTQPHMALWRVRPIRSVNDAGLFQKPLHDRPSAQNGPQSAFGQLTPPYRTTVYGVFSVRK